MFIGGAGVALNVLDNDGGPAPNTGIVDGGGTNEKPLAETTGAVDGWVVFDPDPKPNEGGVFDVPKDIDDETELAGLSTEAGVIPNGAIVPNGVVVPNGAVVPNEAVVLNAGAGVEFMGETTAGANGLGGLPVLNPNWGLLDVVVEVSGKLRPPLPNRSGADVVAVDVNAKLLGIVKALVVVEDAGNEIVVAVGAGAGVIVEEPNKFEVVAVVVVKDGAEVLGANVNAGDWMDDTVDTTGVAVAVVVVIGLLLNGPKGIDVDGCNDDIGVGILGIIVAVEGTVELVTAVVRLGDDTGVKGWNAVPIWKGAFALVVNVLSNVVVPNKGGVLLVTGPSLVVAVPNKGGVLVVTELSLVVVVIVGDTTRVIPKTGGAVLIDTEFSWVVVGGDTIGVVPNNGVIELVVIEAVVVTGVSLVVVIGDTIGTVPNNGVVAELVVIGAVMIVELSLVVTGTDVIGVVFNNGKVILVALVVTVGGIDKIFSLVVVGIIWLVIVVLGIDIVGSFAITSGNLLDDIGCFSIVFVGSIAKLKKKT